MEKWFISKKKADFEQIGKKFGIDPVIARLIRNRDITDEEEICRYLSGKLSDISDPSVMKDADKACILLCEAIREGKKIRIISDYDVDGVISNYILWKSLNDLGGSVDFIIPDRIQDGYGMNTEMVLNAKEDGIGVIITCDNGIAAFDAVKKANDLNMAVIVTDHHEVPYQMREGEKQEILPPADAVVDPKQEACAYPYKQLCGAGVAFQLMRALYQMMGRDEKDLEPLLCFLAVATVCDVVDLTKENRIFVREGLKLMSLTQNTGLRALLEVHNLKDASINSYHLGFVIGPCINASGRLESA